MLTSGEILDLQRDETGLLQTFWKHVEKKP